MVLTAQLTRRAEGDLEAEALFKEARRRQRRRRIGVAVLIAAILAAGTAAAWWPSLSPTSRVGATTARSVATGSGRGQLLIRPVLCYAPPYAPTPAAIPPNSSTLRSNCTAQYQVVPQNLGGQASRPIGVYYNLPLDPALAAYPSTSASTDAHSHNSYVLLPGISGSGRLRYLLGPAALTGRIIQSATVILRTTGALVIDCTLTSAGAAAWDRLAHSDFHEVLAFDWRGIVQTAPTIQPTQPTFTSFGGVIQLQGFPTQASAERFLADLAR